jgi:hypothetical protein
MSPQSPSRTELSGVLDSDALPALSRYGAGLKTGVTTVAFWTAIILPFLHVPLLLTGLERTSVQMAFVALVVLNVVAVLLGQPYHRD